MPKSLAPWQTTHRTDNFTFQLIDPHNLDIVRGELTGVQLDDLSITEDYDSDNRMTGKLTAVDDGSYIDNSWIRVIHSVPEFNYREEIGTFIPVTYTHTYFKGMPTTEYTLESTLWGIAEDILPYHFSVGAGQRAKNVFGYLLNLGANGYLIKPNAHDKTFTAAVVYELGDSIQKILFDLSDRCNNHITLDGHGRIVWEPYINLSSRAVDWELDADNSIVLTDSNTWTDDFSDVTNRVIVSYKNDDNEIIGSADAPSSSRYSDAKRGYTRATVDQENDLNPATTANANAIAQRTMRGDITQHIEHQITTMYFPGHQGEIVNYTQGGTTYKCLITNVDASFSDWQCKLTLREVRAL